MGKITLILGGTGSGKSSYAVNLAKNNYKKVAFIATCPYFDEETRERIKYRKQERPSNWQTFEEFTNLTSILSKIYTQNDYELVIIDCLTLFVSNLMLENVQENVIAEKVKEMMNILKNAKYDSIIITDEMGLNTPLEKRPGRIFNDILGRINQLAAKKAENVYFIIAGIPLKLKDHNSLNTQLSIQS